MQSIKPGRQAIVAIQIDHFDATGRLQAPLADENQAVVDDSRFWAADG